MIDLRVEEGRCFAAFMGGKDCAILQKMPKKCTARHCRFYKPKGCRDWVRINNALFPPEEYEART